MSAFVQGYALLIASLALLGVAAMAAVERGRDVLAAVLVTAGALLLCGGLGYVWLVGEVAS